MKIRYEFLTGEAIEIEVTEKIGKVSIAIDRDIQNSNRRETRRHNSMEELAEQGIQIADASNEIAAAVEVREEEEALHKALKKLLPRQRELVWKVFFEEKPIVEVAKELGITKQACNNRLNKIYKQLEKYL